MLPVYLYCVRLDRRRSRRQPPEGIYLDSLHHRNHRIVGGSVV